MKKNKTPRTDRVITFHALPQGRFLYFWASRLSVPGGTGPVRQWWGVA